MESDTPYLGLDHVDPPRAQLPDAVVDVHHALSLRHVQHDVDDDEAARPSRPRAVRTDSETSEWCHRKNLSFKGVRLLEFTFLFPDVRPQVCCALNET